MVQTMGSTKLQVGDIIIPAFDGGENAMKDYCDELVQI